MRRALTLLLLLLTLGAASAQTFTGTGTPILGKGPNGEIGYRVGPNTFRPIGTVDPVSQAWRPLLQPPTTSILGGVLAKAAIANQFIVSVNPDGSITSRQPIFADIAGVATTAQLPVGTSGATICLLNASCVWSGNNSHSGSETFTGPIIAQNAPAGFAGFYQFFTPDGVRRGYIGFGDGGTNLVFTGDNSWGLKIYAPQLISPAVPGLTGYLYGNNGTGVTASATIPTLVLSGTLQAGQFPALTGDVTTTAGSLATTIQPGAVTAAKIASGAAASNVGTLAGDLTGTLPNPALATVNANTGSVGGASAVPVLTLDAKGRAIAASTTPVVAPAGTLSGATLNATVVNSSLQTLGTITIGTWNGSRIGLPYMVQAAAGTLRGNIGGATADVADYTLAAIADAAFGTTRGAIPYRGAGSYTGLAPGATGTVLTSNGPGNDPSYQTPGVAASPPRSAVRQTVQGGPQSGGLPSFLPATSANLNLTTQNVGTGANALTVAAAQGYNTTGQNDVISQYTSNLTFNSLVANSTNYLYINPQNSTTYATTLGPIYQFGGAPSTVNGQVTFDYQAMIGYLGNGSAAVATSLVAVGEADTSASAVTATRAYAYNGYYEVTVGTLPTSGSQALTAQHNLGVNPTAQPVIFAINKTSEYGYSIGDRVTSLANGFNGQVSKPAMNMWASRLQGGTNTGNDSGSNFYTNFGRNGAQQQLTSANWVYGFVFRRGWGGA